ncbi:MAG: hypothetical protein V1837_08145 [Candidatus Woesearchaeota archaeon]
MKHKTNNDLVFLLGILALLIIVVAVGFQLGVSDKKPFIANLTFSEVSGDDIMSFSIINENNEPCDCIATMTIKGKQSVYTIGIIKPQSSKLVSSAVPDGASQQSLEPVCECKPFDTAGCESTDFRICEMVRSQKDLAQCLGPQISDQYLCLAVLKQDPSLCDNINVNYKRTKCKALLFADPSFCESLPQPFKDSCLEDYGMNKQDQEACAKIITYSKKQACLGVATESVEYCQDVDEPDKLLCALNLAEFINDASVCNIVQNPDDCYSRISFLRN